MEALVKILEGLGYAVTWVVWNFGGKHIYRLVIFPLSLGGARAIYDSENHDIFESVAASISLEEVQKLLATAIYNHVRVYGVAR